MPDDEIIHANCDGRTLCGNALRACSDDRVSDNDEEVTCWECRSML